MICKPTEELFNGEVIYVASLVGLLCLSAGSLEWFVLRHKVSAVQLSLYLSRLKFLSRILKKKSLQLVVYTSYKDASLLRSFVGRIVFGSYVSLAILVLFGEMLRVIDNACKVT